MRDLWSDWLESEAAKRQAASHEKWLALHFPEFESPALRFADLLEWHREHHAALCDLLHGLRPVSVSSVSPVTLRESQTIFGRTLRWLEHKRSTVFRPVAKHGGWHVFDSEFQAMMKGGCHGLPF